MCQTTKFASNMKKRKEISRYKLPLSSLVHQSSKQRASLTDDDYGRPRILPLCLLLLTLAATVQKCTVIAHQYPDDQLVDQQQQQQVAMRAGDENEAQQLRQLHQVVDTMSQLLNEEEQQPQPEIQNSAQIDSNTDLIKTTSEKDGAQAYQSQQQQLQQHPFGKPIQHDLMSERDIRSAIEELERIQRRERQEEAEESRQRPVVAEAPSASAAAPEQQQADKQKSAFEVLIDELGDELIDDQLAVASNQDQDRLIQRDPASNRQQADKSGERLKQQETNIQANISNAPVSTTIAPSSLQQANGSSFSSQTQSSLFIGQLDSLASELGPALTNDFYTFHAEANGSPQQRDPSLDANQYDARLQSAASEGLKPTPISLINQVSESSGSGDTNDLEPSAQTRNSVTRHESPSQSFRSPTDFDQSQSAQQASSPIRFNFNRPQSANLEPQPSQSLVQPQVSQLDQDALVRNFRQQTGAAGPLDDKNSNQQFPTSTLIPLTGPENFWRSTGSNGYDLSDQYNRESSDHPSLPPLPASRFQSLSPPPLVQQQQQPPSQQFSQPAPTAKQHIHFTGHSFVPNQQQQFAPPQQNNVNINNNNARERSLPSSTAAPMISVLSGSDTSIGQSVSWNPPATISPPARPPQQLFSQQYPNPTSHVSHINPDSQPQPFFPSTSPRSQSPLFNAAIHGLPEDAPEVNDAPLQTQRDPRQQFQPTSTQSSSNLPEGVTEFSTFPPSSLRPAITSSTTTQRSSLIGGFGDERLIANSEPRNQAARAPLSSTNMRFFSPNDLISPPSSTSSPSYFETSRPSRFNAPTTTTQASTSAPSITTIAPEVNPAKNTTAKKDDMVIYYYYYYDDNKNATVVAKNVSSNSAVTDAAIEADGGLEDTPYMDDPVPIGGLRTNSVRGSNTISSTSNSITSSPTTTVSPFPTSSNRSRGSSISPLPHSTSVNPTYESSTTSSSRSASTFDREFNDQLQSLGGFHNDQQRTTPASTRSKQDSAHHSMPSRPSNGRSSSAPTHEPTGNVFASPNSAQRAPSSSHTQHHKQQQPKSRLEAPSHEKHSTTSSALSHQKLQKDLNQNLSLGNQPRQNNAPQPAVAASSHSSSSSSRGPLSNASRYGTSNNQFLDPYGLDPSAPASISHSGYSSSTSDSHKNWQPQPINQITANVGQSHQLNRKPSATVPIIPMTEHPNAAISTATQSSVSGGSSRSSNNQHFSSLRNVNSSPNSSTQSNPTSRVPQPFVSVQSSTGRASTFSTSTLPNVSTTGHHHQQQQNQHKHFTSPEDTAQRTGAGEERLKVANSLQKQPTFPEPQQFSLGRQATSTQSSRLVSSSDNPNPPARQETSQRLSGSGRPSRPEGNTANGFTRSPIQVSSFSPTFSTTSTSSSVSSSSSFSISPQRDHLSEQQQQQQQRAPIIPAVNQPQTNTSFSRSSFVQPQQSTTTSISQPEVPLSPQNPPTFSSTSTTTTSASPVSSDSTAPASTSSESSQPQLSLENIAPVSASPPSVLSSTSASQPQAETSSQATGAATESVLDSSSGSSLGRRRFGNRNNKFQTRLSSLNSSNSRSTSTTSTTQAPLSSSTTRRPTTSSTTRKSSKQLFAGRKRLNSFNFDRDSSTPSQQPTSPSPIAASSVNMMANVTASASADNPIVNAPASSTPASPSLPARSKFGNSFTSRSRTTTPNPAGGQRVDKAVESTQKPSLFGSQRASSKPRLPFLGRGNNNRLSSSTSASTVSDSSTASSLLPDTSSVSPNSLGNQSTTDNLSSELDKAITDKSVVASGSVSTGDALVDLGDNNSLASTGPIEDESNVDKKDSSASFSAPQNNSLDQVPTVATTTMSPPPAAQEQPSARNKPKVRPLFASRQRNSSLFGNRRNTTNGTTT